MEDITQYLHSSRLYETKEEIQERLETVRVHIRTQEAVERLSVRRQEFMERLEALFAEKHLLDEDSYLSGKKVEMDELDEFAKIYGYSQETKYCENVWFTHILN